MGTIGNNQLAKTNSITKGNKNMITIIGIIIGGIIFLIIAWFIYFIYKSANMDKYAEKGDSQSQYFLGMMYLIGEDVPQDIEKGIDLVTKSAEQGNQYAQESLGKMYIEGAGVPRDLEKAIELLTKSAAQGNKGAKNQLKFAKLLRGE